MKTIKFLKINVMAIVAILFASAVMSFAKPEKKAAPQTFYYSFSGMADGDFAIASHWQLGNPEDCETEGLKPCTIVVPEGQTLSGILAGKDNDAVLAVSIGRRP